MTTPFCRPFHRAVDRFVDLGPVLQERADVLSSPPEKWSSPRTVTGQPPPPCSDFTLTPVDEGRAALFGGRIGPRAVSDDLLIVELTKHTVVSV